MNEVWAADEVWAVDKTWPLNTTDVSLEDYLLMKRGPKHLPLTVVIPITLIYTVIFFSGVVGNIATCLVIVTNPSLHNATNYYLFSLSMSDITLLLLGLPNDLSVFWQQYPWRLGQVLCKLRALVSEMTSYSSVLTIVAFSMERYLAICHPLVSYTMAGLRRASCIVSFLWLLSFLGALPFSIYTEVNYITYPPDSDVQVEESAFCGTLEENIPKTFPIYELSFLVFFFVPLCIIILLYCLIGLQIRSKPISKHFHGTIHKKSKKSQSRKSIIRMLVAVVVTFFVCWAPYHAQRLYYFYGRGGQYYYLVNEWLYYVAGCFYYLSATANPILYNLMSVKYRNGFRRTFCGRRASSQPHTVSRQRSTTNQASLPEENREPLLETGAVWKKTMVQIQPDRKCTTVTTETHSWARCRVTIDHPSTIPPDTITVHMETT